MAKVGSQKERGKFLLLFFVIQGLLWIVHFWNVLLALAGNNSGAVPLSLRFVDVVVFGTILVGIWKWQKLAAYAFFVYFVVAGVYTFILGIALYRSQTTSDIPTAIVVFPAVLLFALYGLLWVWAIKRKWPLFA